jgi:hypothetical protein
MLVELHNRADQGLTPATGADELTRRFSGSHRVSRIGVDTVRSASQLPIAAKLTEEELAQCLDEGRTADQLWLWLEARQFIDS